MKCVGTIRLVDREREREKEATKFQKRACVEEKTRERKDLDREDATKGFLAA